MRLSKPAFAFALFALLPACALDPEAPQPEGSDPGAIVSQGLTDGLTDAADSLSSTSTYYTLEPDLRQCAPPECGGYFVRRVNQPLTQCADGSWRNQCYVWEVEWGATLSGGEVKLVQDSLAGQRALVRGVLSPDLHGLGVLDASEAWVAAASDHAPTGSFFRINGRGIVCIDSPCFSIHEARLNSVLSTNLSDVDFEASGASPPDIAAAHRELGERAILVAGRNEVVIYPSGRRGLRMRASQLYFRVAHSTAGAGEGEECGGAKGQECDVGLFCDISVPDACDGSDLPGVCREVGEACIQIFQPVCGCDQNTYSNDCFRMNARVQLDHEGPCE